MEAKCCDCGGPIAESMGFVKASALTTTGEPPREQPARCYKCVERHELHAFRAQENP